MRITLETEDLQAIAEMVARKLTPVLAKVQEAVERPPPAPNPIQLPGPEAARSAKPECEVVRSKDLRQLTGLSRSSIWRLERDGDFPARVRLTRTGVGWRRTDIETWLATRPQV
jgi:predicted DNA-binding transcriptional regulator AlpA